jgi:hypothetical protein
MSEQYNGFTITRLAVVDNAAGPNVALIRHVFMVTDADGRKVGQFPNVGAARVAADTLALRQTPRRLSA